MSIKKILCLVLALVLCGAAALAEPDLESANARIAELEAEVEKYKPYYDAQVIVEYDGGAIFLDDVLEEYSYYEQMYSQQYGIDLASYGLDAQVKQQAAQHLWQFVGDMGEVALAVGHVLVHAHARRGSHQRQVAAGGLPLDGGVAKPAGMIVARAVQKPEHGEGAAIGFRQRDLRGERLAQNFGKGFELYQRHAFSPFSGKSHASASAIF